MRILLTGGFGYLGGRLAQSLAHMTGHELTLASRRAMTAPAWAPQARVSTLDWTNERELRGVCQGMDAIVHMAGMNAEACANDAVAALEFNGVGTARLLRAAIDCGVSRFIYLSTAHVYGAALSGSVDEHTCPQPRHPYATSHRAGEDVVLAANATSAIQGLVVRLSNCFGAPMEPGVDCWYLLTNDLCRQAVTTRRMILKTAGRQRRDFMAMAEACRAITHLLAALAPSVADGLFNVGSGWAPTLLEIAELAASRVTAALGFRPEIQTGSAHDSVGNDDLKFGIGRLLNTGFQLRPQAVTEELDRLVLFCDRHASSVGRDL